MEQRPLRLGDIVDDYCPRERRITNHAIVAIVENTIRQTRCTTCDAEHVYKEARVPRRRKADPAAEAPGQLVASRAESDAESADLEEPLTVASEDDDVLSGPDANGNGPDEPVQLSAMSEAGDADAADVGDADDAGTNGDGPADREHGPDDGWLAHRRLIRASLPRVDGEAPARPIPEFTMHQRQTRGSHMFRSGQGGNFHGNGQGGQGHGHGGNGQGQNQGQGRGGNGGGRGRNRSGRRHKRSR